MKNREPEDIPPSGKHLHFPFKDTVTNHCNSHKKHSMEESVAFPYTVGYGMTYTMSAWYTANKDHQYLPTIKEIQDEENKDEIDHHDRKNTIEGGNYETKFVDDPRNGAKPMNNNFKESINRILHKLDFRDEVNADNLEEVILEEDVDDPVSPHASDNVTQEECCEEIFVQHKYHSFINTEAILLESKFVMAEISETEMKTPTNETYTHWDKIEVWDTQKYIDEVDVSDQIEIGTDVVGNDQIDLYAIDKYFQEDRV